MSQFVFNGSSRMRNVTFARDHHKTRTSIIEDAQRQRQRREEEQRRTRAAQKVQRAARQWLARMRVVGLALARVAALPQEVQTLLSPSPPSTTDQMTASVAAVLHGACWSMAFAVRHSTCIPLHGLPPLHHVTSDTADEENPQGGAATPRTLGHSIVTLEQLSAYQQATLRRYGSLLCSALRRCAHHVPNPDTEAPSQGVSLLWQQLLALASTRHTSLLLYVLLQEVAARQDGSAKAGDALAMASAGQDSAVVASVVETIVHQNKAFSSTLNEEDHAPVQPHATHHQPPPPDSPYRHHHDHRGGGAGACYSLEASSPAHVDRWPAVQALCMALELSCQEPALSNADTRAELAAVLQPLVAVFPSPPPPSPSACSAHDAGGGAALSPSAFALLPSAFALACWRCLCANYAGDEYQMLTADPLATLLCAEAAQDAQDATGGRDGCCAVMLDECYRRTAADARLLPGSEVNGVRGGELRARVLGRMVRLMPQVHALVQSSAPYAAVLVQRYLLSVSCLSERLCREAFFIESILADHYAYNTGRRAAAAAAAAATSATTATTATAAIATQSSTTPAAGHGASRSHYRLLSSYLFSAEGGLRLLQLLTAQDEAREQLRLRASQEPTVEAPTETAALSADALSAPSAGDHGAEQPQGDPSITAQAASASPPSSSATAPAPAASSSPSAVWSTSASAQQSPLEVLCNIFAWPLFTFSKPDYARYQQETLALCAKLVRTPQLLRRLWSLYWQSCEGLRAVLPPGPALQKLCARPVWSEQEAAGAAAAPARERAEGRRVPSAAAAAASTPLLASLPRLPTWETHPRYPMCFYDPHPSLSIFLFTLLAHYVNVCDFADELRRGNGAVVSCEEACALILALKEIVHRAHLYGVVPDSNGEAVAHAACLLLARLHTVNEADGFVPPGGEGLWMSVGMVAAENAVGAIVSRWDEASAAVVAEETADSEADGPATAAGETAARERGVAQGSTGSAAAAAAADAAVLARLPGDDVMFRDSRNWDTKARFIRLLVHAPFLVPFPARALLLSALLAAQEERWAPPPERPVVVHRGRIFLDAFTLFHDNPMSSNVYNIRFVSPDGSLEAGYGRGVYRECIVSLCKEGFAAEYGLFRQTTDGYVFPNSFSAIATSDPQHLQKIRFLGAMVGRALHDGVLQDVPFALHFRNALLGRRNSLSNLKSFDAELYHQLMSLTQLSEEELEAVGLTFVYTVNSLGVTREVELVKGGAQMEVTPRNCLYYVHLVADFKLNREAAEQTRAFCDGLHGVLDLNRLRLFDSVEVGKLFGGDESGAIDLQDWKENTVYDRPEDAKQPQVRLFWDVVESLTRKQQSLLLKFVTSMTRPPLLGFSFLSPPFKLQLLTNTVSGSDHLPSAATCFSTLKLPPYTDYATARAKIVAAIEETGTFEFS